MRISAAFFNFGSASSSSSSVSINHCTHISLLRRRPTSDRRARTKGRRAIEALAINSAHYRHGDEETRSSHDRLSGGAKTSDSMIEVCLNTESIKTKLKNCFNYCLRKVKSGDELPSHNSVNRIISAVSQQRRAETSIV